MKKYLLLLVVAMLANIGRAAVGDTFEYDELNYTILSEDDRTVEVEMKDDPSGDLIIPAQVANNGIRYSVTTIGDGAFYECSGLTSVTIPHSVTTIGEAAFSSCSGLTSIAIPNSVTTIGPAAFGACRGLSAINVEKGSKYFSSEDGILYNKDMTALLQCPGAKTECAIPETVTTIGNYAFGWCESLTSVTIPNSVTTIGDMAFYVCRGLTSVTIPKSVTLIGEEAFGLCPLVKVIDLNPSPQPIEDKDVFDGIADDAVLYVPEESIEVYKATEGWSEFSDIRAMPTK
ncbi:MAG: leucine-rich repeat domain-containing protein [Muribaculaceae bacterium]|nr:leucine-rich repeat domain-containing protein [Muribaculaceae bacterium]